MDKLIASGRRGLCWFNHGFKRKGAGKSGTSTPSQKPSKEMKEKWKRVDSKYGSKAQWSKADLGGWE